MRNLIILRGIPASGKSTWIKNNELEQFTVSSDTLRLLYAGIEYDLEGRQRISQKADKKVWNTLFEIVEDRMKDGLLTIVDATHTSEKSIKAYDKLCEKYNYRMTILEFNVDIDEAIKRNNNREEYKQVPENVIRDMAERMKQPLSPKHQKCLVKVENYKTLNDLIQELNNPIEHLTDYNKVIVFGDIHSSYEPLKEYFDKNTYSENSFYIFLGDLFDRNDQANEVAEFMYNMIQKDNVILLQGNHECFHKDTDVLTKDGWKNIKEIVENQENVTLITYNIQTKQLEDDKILKYHKNHADYLYDIETTDSRQVITPGHDVLLGNTKLKAEDLINEWSRHLLRDEILTTANYNKNKNELSENEVDLINWVVCDGSLVFRNYKTYGKKLHHVQFKLARQDKLNYLTNLLNIMKIKYTINDATISKSNVLQPKIIRIYGEFAQYIHKLLAYSDVKGYPKSFLQLSDIQTKRLLHSLSITDGHCRNKNSLMYSTTSKKDLDTIQYICITHGYVCKWVYMNNKGFSKISKIYRCTIQKSHQLKEQKYFKLMYNDDVYCLTTTNGTLVTRFNGKVAITGNCHIKKILRGEMIGDANPEFQKTWNILTDENKEKVKAIGRKVRQYFTFEFNGDRYICTHGGISTPYLDAIMPTRQLIKGVGNYEDMQKCDEMFTQLETDWHTENDIPEYRHVYSIHGHRNIEGVEIHNTERTFNLCDDVEHGGFLRILEITEAGFTPIKIKNNTFRKKSDKSYTVDILDKLSKSEWIHQKDLGNGIVSFNFTRDAFFKKHFDDINVLARGLFVDTENEKIIARSYNKFFNAWFEENDSNTEHEYGDCSIYALKDKITFPATVYKKENGYLGIVSWDYKNNDFFIASKSTNLGDYALHFKEMFMDRLKIISESTGNDDITWSLKDFVKRGYSMIFEVIDEEFDPHIIRNHDDKITKKFVLLDIVKNDFSESYMNYKDLVEFGKAYCLSVKDKRCVVNNFLELLSFLEDYKDYVISRNRNPGKEIEGFVIEDSNGFRFKFKTAFYCFWKNLRNKIENYKKGNSVNFTKDEQSVITALPKKLNEYDNILEVREDYYKNWSV